MTKITRIIKEFARILLNYMAIVLFEMTERLSVESEL